MKNKEWQEILDRVNSAEDLNSDTVIDKIKEILRIKRPDVYEKWEKEEPEFDINYVFQYEELGRAQYMLTLLHASVHYNLMNILNALLVAGANVNVVDSCKKTPLHLAALHGDVNTVNVLLKEGAEVNAIDRHNKAPLHWAAQYSYIEIIKILLENGADINATTKDKETPLHYAVLSDCVDTVNILLENGAEVNARDKHNTTPLHLAARNEHVDIVGALLKNKAIPNLKDSYDQTPISLTWSDEIKQLLQNAERRSITAWAMPIVLIITGIVTFTVFITLGAFSYKAFKLSTEVDEVSISNEVGEIENFYTQKL